MKIMANNCDKSHKVVIKASAGTGKTYRLSLEYIYNLIVGVEYSTIVVMTFTKKATSEIKDRIFDFLYQIAYQRGDYKNLQKSLVDIFGLKEEIPIEKLKVIYSSMIKNKENVRIDTIDGFINKVFKKSIAPFLGINSYMTVDFFDDKFSHELFSRILGDKKLREGLVELSEKINKKKEINDFVNIINYLLDLESYFIMAKDVNHKQILDGVPTIDDLIKEFENILMYMREGYEQSTSKKTKPLEEMFVTKGKAVYTIYNNLIDEYENNVLNSVVNAKSIRDDKFINLLKGYEFSDILDKNSYLLNGRYNVVKDIKRDMGEKYDNFLNDIRNYFMDQEVIPFYDFLKKFASGIYEVAQQLKVDKKIFSHNDKLNYTYKKIFDQNLGFIDDTGNLTDEFFDVIGGEISVFMIDEFQDTSVIQWKILNLVLNKVEKFICVGDEKQSIYKWRGGEKNLFAKMGNIIGANEEELSISYRSYKEIIENVNTIYDGYSENWEYNSVGYRSDDDYQRGYFSYTLNNLKETNKNNEKSDENNNTNVGYNGKQVESQENFQEDEEDETKDTVETIGDLLLSGKIKNFGKTCIIARYNKEINRIVQVLNKKKIPYTVNSSASILTHKAVQPLYKLLKYVLFGHPIFLLEFLRSDLIGAENKHVKYILENYDEIEQYLSRTDTNKISENALNSEIDSIKRYNSSLSEVLYKILKVKQLFTNGGTKHFVSIAREIVNTFDVGKYYSTKSDTKNIFLFIKHMSNFSDLHEFISFLDENEYKLTQESSVDVNAVNLMTIHKSKGLEFDTVIYYKNNKSGKGGKESIKSIVEYDDNYSTVTDFLVYPTVYKKYLSPKYNRIIKENSFGDTIEEINADYVALTRAKKNLIIYLDYSQTTTNKKKDPSEKTISNLKDKLIEKYGDSNFYQLGNIVETPVVFDEIIVNNNDNTNENVGTAEVNDFLQYISQVKSQSKKNYGKGYVNDTESEKVLDDSSEDRNIKDKLDEHYQLQIKTVKKRRYSLLNNEVKRKIGLAVHYYLSHIKSGSETEKEIAKNALMSRYSNMIGEKVANNIIIKLNKYIEDNKNVFTNKFEIYTELVVFFKVDNEGNILDNSATQNYTIKKNIIDRLQINYSNKKITIYDYKTGYDDLKREMYNDQLRKYKKIIEKIVGDSGYEVKYMVLDLSEIVKEY